MKLTEEIEKAVNMFIVNTIEEHPNDLVSFVMNHFELSRPTVMRLIKQLIENNTIIRKNPRGRNPGYQLKTTRFSSVYQLGKENLQEDKIYYESVMPHVENLPKNIQQLFEYSAMEIINNAIEHSGGSQLTILVSINLKHVEVDIIDNGVGIFNKIQKDLDLQTPQQSILELCKGKFTSDPKRHSGEGIFFSSRMVDQFIIFSYGIIFNGHEDNDMIYEANADDNFKGTAVRLLVNRDTKRTPIDVFDIYSDQDKDPTFHRRSIPVRIMNIEGGNLVSRSQAKRLLTRVERFTTVVLDFEGVEMIGQAFADEIFRVFKATHPDVKIVPENANANIGKMIRHVESSIQ